MIALATAELNRPLSVHLTVLGELQQKMKDLHEKQVFYHVELTEIFQCNLISKTAIL
jgi:hypothetical protein